MLRETGVDWLGVVVPRSDVERGDIGPTFGTLDTAMADSETVRTFQGQVDISFEGYDQDPREIYEIPEVRRFVRDLDEKFPYWFYFLSTELNTLRMLTFCLCSTRQLKPGLVRVAPDDLQRFLVSHFAAMNDLFAHFRLDERISEEISQCILDYFSGQPSQ